MREGERKRGGERVSCPTTDHSMKQSCRLTDNTSERAMYRDYRKEADLGQWGGRQCLQWQERES